MEEGSILARQSGERWFEAWAIYNLGHLDGVTGRYEQGYEQSMAGLGMWRELGDPQVIALGLNFLVTILIQLGRFAEAKNFMHESIALCEQSKNHWGRGTAYRYLGLTYLAEGEFAQAQAHLLKSLEIFGEFSEGWDIARSLTYLGDAALIGGELPEARKYYREGLQCAIEARAIPIALDALLGMAHLQARAGKEAQCLLLCYFILLHGSSEEDTKRRAGQLAENREANISSEEIKEMRSLAQEQTLDQVAKEVLEAE